MTAVVKTAGGTFDPKDTPTFFMAGARAFNDAKISAGARGDVERFYKWLLIAVTQMDSQRHMELVEEWCNNGARVFLDSGIFPLTNAHARAHNVTMDEALALAPDEIDGFDELLAKYMDVCRALGSKLWGYTELDQGGAANKRRTRAMLEAEGLRPIPIYHPLNDGWDYLDELVERYDRICIGNVVQANAKVRAELLLTAWERLRRYKRKPWVHVLGHTPNPLFVACPFNSADSTEYIYALQYGSHQNNGRAMLANFSSISDAAFSSDMSAKGDDAAKLERGDGKGSDFSMWIAHTDLLCWQRIRADLADQFGDLPVYPKLVKGESVELRAAGQVP